MAMIILSAGPFPFALSLSKGQQLLLMPFDKLRANGNDLAERMIIAFASCSLLSYEADEDLYISLTC